MTNYFTPAKLISKTRDGAKVTKRYDNPKTPYQRLLDHPDVDAVTKLALGENYRALSPAQIRREIGRLQQRLLDLNIAKIIKAQKGGASPTSIRTFLMRQRPHHDPDILT